MQCTSNDVKILAGSLIKYHALGQDLTCQRFFFVHYEAHFTIFLLVPALLLIFCLVFVSGKTDVIET